MQPRYNITVDASSLIEAIIGWEPTDILGTPNIGIAYLTVFGKRLWIGLCGVQELSRQADKQFLSSMVMVQCGGGSWTKALRLPPDASLYDLSQYSTFKGHYGGVLPRLDESYTRTFDNLIGEFKKVWSNLTHREGAVFLFAKRGCTGRMHS